MATRNILLLLASSLWLHAAAQSHRFVVHLDSSFREPVTGRLYIFSVTDTSKGVRDPDPFQPTPTFHLDVANWLGGQTRTVDDQAAGYPVNLRELKTGYYKFAAVLDADTVERSNTVTSGNYYSRDVLAFVERGKAGETHLHLSRRIPLRPFRESQFLKHAELKSGLVSMYLKRESWIKAAVVLPPSYYRDSSKRYPLVLIIPGWGGSHYDALHPQIAERYGFGIGKEKIYVYLNPETSTPFGVHAFVDSRVNGPWGKALVQELLPYLSKHYRITTDPDHRFLIGQSSGGYGALWLHLHYPEAFGGSWAVSPDPVDFRDFIGVDLYGKNANLFVDPAGGERPFFIRNAQPVTTLRRFAELEHFLGTGGQLQSFEAAFGVPGKARHPQPVFDRSTGVIYPAMVEIWKPYDLSLYLQHHYRRLSSRLAGRVHVYAGDADNFGLHRSVSLLKQRMAALNAAVKTELIPGADHWSIWNRSFTERIQREMEALMEKAN